MASLSDAMPRDLFGKMFSTVTELVTARDTPTFYENDPNGASVVNLFAWDEAVHRGLVANGWEMNEFHPHDLVGAYNLTKARLGREPFNEVFCVEFYNEHSGQSYFGQPANFPFAQIDLVHCYPNDVHIADLTLSDLTQPVRQTGGIAPRSHRGLHVFPVLLERLLAVARSKSSERISLVAASPEAHATFLRYGFKPTDTRMSEFAFKNFGHSHAMALHVI